LLDKIFAVYTFKGQPLCIIFLNCSLIVESITSNNQCNIYSSIYKLICISNLVYKHIEIFRQYNSLSTLSFQSCFKSKIPLFIKTGILRICLYSIFMEFHSKIAGNCQNESTCNTWLFEEFDKNPRGNAHRIFLSQYLGNWNYNLFLIYCMQGYIFFWKLVL
jgi:hypothetical protein